MVNETPLQDKLKSCKWTNESLCFETQGSLAYSPYQPAMKYAVGKTGNLLVGKNRGEGNTDQYYSGVYITTRFENVASLVISDINQRF